MLRYLSDFTIHVSYMIAKKCLRFSTWKMTFLQRQCQVVLNEFAKQLTNLEMYFLKYFQLNISKSPQEMSWPFHNWIIFLFNLGPVFQSSDICQKTVILPKN